MKTFHTFSQMDNVHHLRIPVSNLENSFVFWNRVFAYERDFDFPGPDGVVNWAIKSTGGAPSIVLWLDEARANNPPYYPLFSFALPSEQAVYDLADELDRLGLEHGALTTIDHAARVFAYDPDRNKFGCYVPLHYERTAEDKRLRPQT